MKVYELIQKLAKFDAGTDVDFRVKADFDADVDVDLEGQANQSVNVELDDYVNFDDIDDEERRSGRIIVNLEY